MTYQEFVKEYVGLDEDIINELYKNLPCTKQISIDDIRGIQIHPEDKFQELYIRELRNFYDTNSIINIIIDVNFPFCDFTKISQTLTERKIFSDVVLKLYFNLRKIYFKVCGYDKQIF